MTPDVLLYSVLGIFVVLLIVSIFLGFENIIKIILGNYILGTICFALVECFDLLYTFLLQRSGEVFLGVSMDTWASFVANGDATFVLLFYGGLFWLLFRKSQITIRTASNDSIQKFLYIFLVPLAALSMILTLWIICLGLQIITQETISSLASASAFGSSFITFFTLTPVWILIHGLVTIFITSEIKLRIKTDVTSFDDIDISSDTL